MEKEYLVLISLLTFAFLSVIPNVSHASGTSTPYDEQLGMTFVQNFTALGYNVTAVAQTSGTSGTGPGYLLNGLSNTGYWYQVGLSWNWATTSYGYSPNQFLLSYEVWSPNGTSIYPTSGGTGLLNLSGPVNEGDLVLLNLYFKNNTVILLVKDWNTGATGSLTLPAYGATEFVGSPNYTANNNGFFTGLMTEWYGTNSNFPAQQQVTYSPYGAITSPAWLWADEFYCQTPCYQRSTLGYNRSNSFVYPTSSHYLTFMPGSTEEYTYGGVFITGATPPATFYLLSSNIKNLQTDEGVASHYPIIISVTGGTPPYIYTINFNGRPYETYVSNLTSVTMNFTLETSCGKSFYNGSIICSVNPGTYYYNATVTDNNGYVVSSTNGQIQLNSQPQISLNAKQTTIDAGKQLTVNYNITGGTPPFNVSYFLNGENIGSTLTIPSAGNYSVYARVIDRYGLVANSSQINFKVNHQPTLSIKYNRTITDVDTPINLVAIGNYGTLPYRYIWYVNNQSVASSNTYILSESKAGNYVVFARLTDGAGDTINSSQITFIVNDLPSASRLKVQPSSSGISINNTANVAVSVSGGSPPYSYKWYVNGVLQNDSNSSSYILGNLKSGNNNVTVEVIDAYGNSAYSSYVIDTSINYALIMGVAVVGLIIVGGLVYLLVLRKPKTGESKEKKGKERQKDAIPKKES
jgi:hypothetical protein